MSDAESQAASPIDADSQAASPIDVDILCVHCGYNLRGLTSDGRCPECGGAIADSMRGELLRFADVEWLTKLRLGVALKLWAITLAVLLAMGGGVVTGVTGSPDAVWLIAVVTMFVSAALGLWGTWCITAPDPRLSLSEQSVTLRKVIRACAVAGLASGVHEYSGAGVVAASEALSVVLIAVGGIGSLAGFVATYAELFYLRRFVRRVPDPALAKSTTSLIWVLPIFACCAVAFLGVVFFVVGFPGGFGGPGATTATVPPSSVLIVLPCAGAVFALFLFLWYVRVLTKYRKVFAATIVQAKVFVGQPVDPASVPDHQES
ncbi:MAG: hypothetical protein IID35_08425 [Planctomycetes bacterium]|nr:hypothetical protein [Planctomycetota bacterium]